MNSMMKRAIKETLKDIETINDDIIFQRDFGKLAKADAMARYWRLKLHALHPYLELNNFLVVVSNDFTLELRDTNKKKEVTLDTI